MFFLNNRLFSSSPSMLEMISSMLGLMMTSIWAFQGYFLMKSFYFFFFFCFSVNVCRCAYSVSLKKNMSRNYNPVGFYLFILSEFAIFSTLLVSILIIGSSGNLFLPLITVNLSNSLPMVGTFCLASSSITVSLAYRAYIGYIDFNLLFIRKMINKIFSFIFRWYKKLNIDMSVMKNIVSLFGFFFNVFFNFSKNSKSYFYRWLGITIILGYIFVLTEMVEFKTLPHSFFDGVGACLFYCLVGLHCSHVILGLGFMMSLFYFNKFLFNNQKVIGSEGWFLTPVAMYWHFVDFIWVFVFSIVYLYLPCIC